MPDIDVPPLTEQRASAHILGTLDDRPTRRRAVALLFSTFFTCGCTRRSSSARIPELDSAWSDWIAGERLRRGAVHFGDERGLVSGEETLDPGTGGYKGPS